MDFVFTVFLELKVEGPGYIAKLDLLLANVPGIRVG